MDLVCIHLVACDVAMADAGFRSVVGASGVDMVTSLIVLHHMAKGWCASKPLAESVLIYMDCRSTQLVMTDISVRSVGACNLL